ncbi:MAG: phosphoenolpyruvate carboxykinase, partial [Hyphomicrobiales bacterium]
MNETGLRNSAHGADKFGLTDLAGVHWNPPAEQLYEYALAAKEGHVVEGGAFCAETGVHTGRSPKDKFVVCDQHTEKTIWWEKNGKLTPKQFDVLLADFLAHAKGKQLFAQDLYGGADPKYRIRTRVFTELAWHSLFIRQLLIRPDRNDLRTFVPELTIVDLPTFKADPKRHGCRTETVIAIDFTRKIVLIGGTSYAGEMKKSVFTTLNFYLPAESVMPMHCSANVGPDGDSALFFGLSGTGKTTLSADPGRTLIGDDEHGWGPNGIFNFEGGCYAKCIQLSAEAEPEIYEASHRFGTVLENVTLDPDTRIPDFDDQSKTENTRAAYPLDVISNASRTGRAGHPKNIVMLTADAFGVMPPIAKLSSA